MKKIGLKEKTKDLVTQIIKTKEFKELKEAKKIVDKDNYLKKSVEEYMRQYQGLFSMNLTGITDTVYLKTKLDQEYQHLSEIPEVSRFIQAQKDFTEFISQINQTIIQSIESELSAK